MGLRSVVGGVVAVAALAGCTVGTVPQVAERGATSVTLSSNVFTDAPGPLTSSVTYGLPGFPYSERTVGPAAVAPGLVTMRLDGLESNTEYSASICFRAGDEQGCPGPATFVTAGNADSVTAYGSISYGAGAPLGLLVVQAHTDADGGNPHGRVIQMPRGAIPFSRTLPVTCLTVTAAGAAVGTADQVFFLRSGGAGESAQLAYGAVDDDPAVCPELPTGAFDLRITGTPSLRDGAVSR